MILLLWLEEMQQVFAGWGGDMPGLNRIEYQGVLPYHQRGDDREPAAKLGELRVVRSDGGEVLMVGKNENQLWSSSRFRGDGVDACMVGAKAQIKAAWRKKRRCYWEVLGVWNVEESL